MEKINKRIEAGVLIALMLFVTITPITIQADPPTPNYLIQEWEKTFGGIYNDQAYSVELTNGGYIIAGFTGAASGNTDIYVVKTDENGNTIPGWPKTIGEYEYEELANCIDKCYEGGYIIVGQKVKYGSDLYLIRINENGNVLWEKTFGGSGWDVGISVDQTFDGKFIITGYTSSFIPYSMLDVWILKVSADGREEWNVTYGHLQNNEAGLSVQETTDGGYIIAGVGRTYQYSADSFWLIKLNASGVEQWNRTYGELNSVEKAYSVKQTEDSGYIIAGEGYSRQEGATCVWLVKTNETGIEQWNKSYISFVDDYSAGRSVDICSDGGYIISGFSHSAMMKMNVYIIKTDENGNVKAIGSFGGEDNDYSWAVREASPYHYILTGYTNSTGAGMFDMYLMKVKMAPSTMIYYFNDYDSGEAWQYYPEKMVDGNPDTYASTCSTDIELCNSNTCNGNDLGPIETVHARVRAKTSGGSTIMIFRPIFGGNDGNNYPFNVQSTASWSDWIDITNDTNGPDYGNWTWDDIENLDCDIQTTALPHILMEMFCSKVEIKVEYYE